MLTLIALICKSSIFGSGRQALTVEKMTRANLERDYSTTNLESIAWQVANDFHLEQPNVVNYFQRSKWAQLAKNLFFRVDFNQVDGHEKAVYLGGTVIKITKSNGVYTVNCRQATVRGTVRYAVYIPRRSFNAPFGEKAVPNIRRTVTPSYLLSGEEITQIYNTLYSQIEGQLNAYKAI